MKNYIYLAKDRIETLYGSLGGATKITNEVKASVGTSSINGSALSQKSVDIHLASKLDYVLEALHLEDDLSGENAYIKGTLPLAWNSINRIERNIFSTFWIGQIDCNPSDPCTHTMLLLIGSGHNIIGNKHESGHYYSTSYIDAFFSNYEASLNEKTLEYNKGPQIVTNYGHRASEDLAHIDKINKNIPDESNKQFLINNTFKEQWTIEKYIDKLYDSYHGNYCEYEFVAQVQFSSVHRDNEEKYVRYIVASPLYVSRKKVYGSRTIIVEGKKKYILSDVEYEEHKKNGFASLSVLLNNQGLIKEEQDFTNRMKELFNSMGKPTIFRKKQLKQEFASKAVPIVLDYFYIIQS